MELDLNKGKDQFKEFTTTTTDIFRQFLQWILKNQKELTDENSPNKLVLYIFKFLHVYVMDKWFHRFYSNSLQVFVIIFYELIISCTAD